MSVSPSIPQAEAMLQSGIKHTGVQSVPIASVFDISQNVSQTRERHGKAPPATPLVSPPVIHSCMAASSLSDQLSPPPVTDQSFPPYAQNPFMSPASSTVDPATDENLSSQPPLFPVSSPHEELHQLTSDIHACLDRVAESSYLSQSQVLSSRFGSVQFIGSNFNAMFLNSRPEYTRDRLVEQQRFRKARDIHQKHRQQPKNTNAASKRRASVSHTITSYSRPATWSRSGVSPGGPISQDRVKKGGASCTSASTVLARSPAGPPPIGTRSTSRLTVSSNPCLQHHLALGELLRPGLPGGVAGSGVFPIDNFPRDSGRRGAVASREDKNFENLADICPPLSTLDGFKEGALKAEWKGNPINLSNDPNLSLLHPLERTLASVLRLDCATYITSKRRLFLSRLDCLERDKIFRKTDAQNACHIDVNKASRLYVAYDQVGWLDAHWVKPFFNKVDLSPVQKSA
ncbi:SWIRM domain-containing protein YOR338W [Ceratocystis lukuohia]|uniref:SWIRM domain-containing protein YOR338W n=1 Tax=Ceratocystis lukuohia TaxID=2019550 RepID=A0ABR4M912_9PEZI